MSEVIDRPPVLHKDPLKEAAEPPKRYDVQVWSPGSVCPGKFSRVFQDVFGVPMAVGIKLASTLMGSHRIVIAKGLTAEIAEQKADQASQCLNELIGGCPCGAKAKFIPVESPQ